MCPRKRVNSIEPDSIVAYNNTNPALATVSRPICKYPDRLVYNGTGSTNVAANFHCQHENHDPLAKTDLVAPNAGADGDRDLDGGKHDNDDD
jgi:hypothetical protein